MKRMILLLSSGILAACGASPKKGEALMESVLTYNDGLRWERIAAAASRVPPAEREAFVDERDELAENLKITDWEVMQVSHQGDEHARVQVKYTWYLDDEGVVHHTQAVQQWARKAKAWLLIDETFARGDDMPGLPSGDPEPEAL
jgi:hypothetical protein